jgi:hypothetical protein
LLALRAASEIEQEDIVRGDVPREVGGGNAWEGGAGCIVAHACFVPISLAAHHDADKIVLGR